MTSTKLPSTNHLKIYLIPLKDIKISETNVRKHSAEKDLQELADSIKKHGQLQAIELRGEYGKPPYEVIIGQRRFLALRDVLKADRIKATFSGKITDIEASIRSLAENLVRTDLTYEETADVVTRLYEHFGRDEHRVKKETGLPLRKIRQFIYLEARASKKTKARLRKGEVSPVDVQRALWAAQDDIKKADELLELMKKYKLDKYQKTRLVDYGREHPQASAEEIARKAKIPVVERAFFVTLSDKVRFALIKASEELHTTPDELAARAVEEWLTDKGFV